jgi:hypothetical protein
MAVEFPTSAESLAAVLTLQMLDMNTFHMITLYCPLESI